MLKKKNLKPILAALAVVVLILVGGNVYITDVLHSLWLQSVTDVMEVTTQGGHAFELSIQANLEMLHALSKNLSQKLSDDREAIIRHLKAFDGMAGNYSVVILDDGLLYSNLSEKWSVMDQKRLDSLGSLSGSGIEDPYLSDDTGLRMLGCYECFTFADGKKGILRLEKLLSDISDEFSISFYGNRGFSYIVSRQGDILIRSKHRNSNHTFLNVFDIIDLDGNSAEALDSFRNALSEEKSGMARFRFNAEEYVYAYVPLDNTDGWHLISIIPHSVIMEQATQIMRSSQLFVALLLFMLFLAASFVLLLRRNHKNVMEKELEVQYREQLFSILTSNTDEVFIMFSMRPGKEERHVDYVSPNVDRVLGIPLEEVKENLDVLDVKEGNGNDGFYYGKLSQMDVDSAFSREVERVHKTTGERRWFLETIYRVTIDGADKFVLTLSDRTSDNKKKEALRQAVEIAEAANRSKSAFLSNMSHDIRTPMNAIVGLCTLLQRDADNPEWVRNHTRKITASSQHLLSLINDVLDMSKIESGKTTLNITEINLAEIVEELETIIRPQAKAKRQDFRISVFDVQTEFLLGDKLRINQILINILSNAIKYTQVGGEVRMIVQQLEQSMKNYAHLRFTIQDNGIGMSQEYVKTIFQPFTREISSTTNKIQGTGLGMAITKNLVDLMGGTISVESAPGEGSTFTVDLELRMQEQDIDQFFWKKHGLTHALIVDDEIDICTSIIGAMKGTGVSMRYATSGLAAIETVNEAHNGGNDFNLVLIDWKMPEMDGIETARRIRQILPRGTSIMMLSAYDWSEIEQEALAAGIDGFMPKPFFITNFKRVIETLKADRESEPTPASFQSILDGKKILVAEDNELNSEILSELLAMVGATCEIAENGKEVLEKFEQSAPGQYDLILMDVQMPIMNGYEATAAIRASAHPLAKGIPIIAMTANAFAEDIKNALDSGMDAHVAKPVDLGLLEVAVSDVFSRKLEAQASKKQ